MRDLIARIPNAKDFRYGEFIKSDTATRLGINNNPTNEQVWKNIEHLAQYALQPIRDKFGGIRITSGYRCIKLCLAIGSTPHSNHTIGTTADFEPVDSNVRMIDIMEWIVNNLEWKELIAENFPGGWIHLAVEEGNDKRDIKLKDHNHNYTKMTFESIKSLYDK